MKEGVLSGASSPRGYGCNGCPPLHGVTEAPDCEHQPPTPDAHTEAQRRRTDESFFPAINGLRLRRYEFDPLFGKERLGPKHERREVSITLKICLRQRRALIRRIGFIVDQFDRPVVMVLP